MLALKLLVSSNSSPHVTRKITSPTSPSEEASPQNTHGHSCALMWSRPRVYLLLPLSYHPALPLPQTESTDPIWLR